MQHGSRRLFTLALLATLVAARPAAARKYDLRQLLARALADNPGVQAARAGVDVADAQVSESARLLWPQGELTLGLTGSPSIRCEDASGNSDPIESVRESNCVRTNVVDLQTFGPAQGFVDILPIHGLALQANARLLQPLF